nr:reverse transcriptase domain, reverse transcriptase zinc-binding domain protein [Tanacetum cinerariifolium]
MGDSDWQEVNKKKLRSVFERLIPSQSPRSNVDDLAKISLSVYVSNFPSHITVRKLWNICGKAGTLANFYIAKRKNKFGQMFAFCRYLKVSNPDVLIGSLCKTWIGKLHLHANVARFGRNEASKPSQASVKAVNSVSNNDRFVSSSNKSSSYVNAAKASSDVGKRCHSTDVDDVGKDNHVLELSQAASNDFILDILGCYKDFRSIANARILCRSEGFLDIDVKYLGGLWVMFEFKSLETQNKFLKHEGILTWFFSLKPWHDDFVVEERLVWLEIEGVPLRAWENDTFNSICRKWGDVLFSNDSDTSNRLSKRLCIKSTHSQLIFATLMVSWKKITYAIRIRELCSRTPT